MTLCEVAIIWNLGRWYTWPKGQKGTPKRKYTPENSHSTQKLVICWCFSFLKGWCSGSMEFSGEYLESTILIFWHPHLHATFLVACFSSFRVSAELLGGFTIHGNSSKWTFLCHKYVPNTQPIPSMGLVYLPTWMVDFYGKCRHNTWMIWAMKTHTHTPVQRQKKILANSLGCQVLEQFLGFATLRCLEKPNGDISWWFTMMQSIKTHKKQKRQQIQQVVVFKNMWEIPSNPTSPTCVTPPFEYFQISR